MSDTQNKEIIWLEKVLNFFVTEKRLLHWRLLPEEGKIKKVELHLSPKVAEYFSKPIGDIKFSGEIIVLTAATHRELAETCWKTFYNQLEVTEHRYKDKLWSPIKHHFAEKALNRWSKWKGENAPK
jgi:hypothetical protein